MKDLSIVDVVFDVDYFKELMKEKRLTYKKLAFLTGIENSTICNYASGRRVPISPNLYKIAIVLDVTSDDLLKEI